MAANEIRERISKAIDDNKKNLQTLAEQFKPVIISAYLDYKKRVNEIEGKAREDAEQYGKILKNLSWPGTAADREDREKAEKLLKRSEAATAEAKAMAKEELKGIVSKNLLKSLLAEGIYEVNTLWGVGGRDLNGSRSVANATYQNTGAFAIDVGKFFADLVPPHMLNQVSWAAVGAERALSLGRYYVELRVKEKTGMTAEVVGTLATPTIQEIAEMVFWFGLLSYSPDPKERLAAALTGIFGEIPRLIADAAIYLVWYALYGRGQPDPLLKK